jgi:hypothetical protein
VKNPQSDALEKNLGRTPFRGSVRFGSVRFGSVRQIFGVRSEKTIGFFDTEASGRFNIIIEG